MQITYARKPYNPVDYHILPNGYVDVFMHKNETTETDDEGDLFYTAEEVYFQIDKSVTKEQIESNFDYFWNDAEKCAIPEQPLELRNRADIDYIAIMTGVEL